MTTTGFSKSVMLFFRKVVSCSLFIGICILFMGCGNSEIPDESELYVRAVEGNVFDTTPVYGEALPLRLRRTGFEYTCSSCHSDFDSEITLNRPEGEHRTILERFDHGRTIYCMSCHHQTERDSYVDNVGQAMSAEHSEELCARCHGLKFRDWEAGTHGRINGYWDEALGERTKVTCTQCHDPHDPAFPKMVPSPAPIRSRLEVLGKGALGKSEHHESTEEGL